MPDTKQLIQDFNQSKIGRVINGRESFRNRVGQYIHGATQHKFLSAAVGGIVLTSAVALAGPIIGFTASLPLWLPGAVALVAPKKQEKAAADFLMNVAVRKSAAFNNYLLKRGYDEPTRTHAVDSYLRDQSPKFGYFKTYQAEHPNAATDIIKAGMKGDLPLCHSPELYQLEALQEILTQQHHKGGILKGLLETITFQNIKREKQAKQIAQKRWADRQVWLANASENKGTWRSFYKDKEFQSRPMKQIIHPTSQPSHGLSDYLKTNNHQTKSNPLKTTQINPKFLLDKYGKSA